MPKKKTNVSKVKLQVPKSEKQSPVAPLQIGPKQQYKEWYDLSEEEVGNAIEQLVEKIQNDNSDILETFRTYARMYGDYNTLGWNDFAFARTEYITNYPTFNVVQSGIDTVASKVARDNPKAYFISSGGDYFDKLKCEKMTQFVGGKFQQTNFYDIANNNVFINGCTYGLGGVQWQFNDAGDDLECEWVFVEEMVIDWVDGQKKKPRSMHRVKVLPKEMLVARYPTKGDEINRVGTVHHKEYYADQQSVVQSVAVTESWHLQNGKHKGRHVVSFATEVLVDEDYPYDYFPFAWFRYYDKDAGFYGRGIPEELMVHQIEINKCLLMIQQCQELQGSPLILADSSSQVAEDSILSNNIARLVTYRTGTAAPVFISPKPADEQYYQHKDWWIQSAYQKLGVSQVSAGGEKTPGVNSAIAMRTQVDIESSRFIQVSKRWEQFIVDNAELTVKLGKRIAEKHPDFKATYTDTKLGIAKDLPWNKINLPDDYYRIKCDTISAFPSSMAGRIQTITEFMSNQLIGRERGLELLGSDPDLEDEIKLQTSTLRLVEKRLCEMVEDNVYYRPEKYMNLQLALTVSLQTYNMLQSEGCPDDRLQLVRMWIQGIETLLTGQDPEVQKLQALLNPQPAPQAPQQVAPQHGIAG